MRLVSVLYYTVLHALFVMLYVLDQKFIFWAKMDTDSVTTAIKEEPLAVEETDDSCLFQYFEVVPLDRDTDGSCTTECVSTKTIIPQK